MYLKKETEKSNAYSSASYIINYNSIAHFCSMMIYKHLQSIFSLDFPLNSENQGKQYYPHFTDENTKPQKKKKKNTKTQFS